MSGLAGDLLGILMRPLSTTRKIAERDSSLKEPFLLLLAIGGITGASGYLRSRWLFSLRMEGLVSAPSAQAVRTAMGFFLFIFGLLSIYLGWILETGVVHGFAKLLGGSGGIRKFSELVGWCQLPRLLSGAASLIVLTTQGVAAAAPGSSWATFSRVFGRLMLFWSLALVGISVAREHRLSRARSALAVALPALIYFVLVYGLLQDLGLIGRGIRAWPRQPGG